MSSMVQMSNKAVNGGVKNKDVFKCIAHTKTFIGFMRTRSSFTVNTWTAQNLTTNMQVKKLGRKKKRKGSNCHQTPTHFVHSIVCSRRVLCGVIHANNLDATGSGTYGELTYSPDFSLAFAKAIQNYSLAVWAMSLFWGTPWQWWEIIGWVVTLSSLLIDEDPVPVRCKI